MMHLLRSWEQSKYATTVMGSFVSRMIPLDFWILGVFACIWMAVVKVPYMIDEINELFTLRNGVHPPRSSPPCMPCFRFFAIQGYR
jgi:hypothetical protein